MNNVRAKFNCGFIQANEDGSVNVNMSAVVSGSPENEAFSESTPSGTLTLHIGSGKPAQACFEQGKDYYIDITPATADAGE